MGKLKSLLPVILMTTISIIIVFGAFWSALAEGNFSTILPTATMTSEPETFLQTAGIPTLSVSTPIVISVTPTATEMIPSPESCPPPSGWVPYIIQIGDNLITLAQDFGISAADIKNANCLETNSLIPDTTIYLPAPPAESTQTSLPTRTEIVCGPPTGWVTYIVQPDDTLYELSIRYAVNITDLQQANCLDDTNLIKSGDTLYVPFVFTASNTPQPGTFTPAVTSTYTWTATLSPAFTETPFTTTIIPPTSTSAPPTSTVTATLVVTDTVNPTITLPPTQETTLPTASLTPKP